MSGLIRFPFALPPDFLRRIGYETFRTPEEFIRNAREQWGVELVPFAPRRMVGLYWQCAGDELALDDGRLSGAGMFDHTVFLAMRHTYGVSRWLHAHDIDLGSSEEPETHWLIVDRETGNAYVAPREHARQIVRQQRLDPV